MDCEGEEPVEDQDVKGTFGNKKAVVWDIKEFVLTVGERVGAGVGAGALR